MGNLSEHFHQDWRADFERIEFRQAILVKHLLDTCYPLVYVITLILLWFFDKRFPSETKNVHQ